MHALGFCGVFMQYMKHFARLVDLTFSFYVKEEGNVKIFYLQQLSSFSVNFDASLIKINWKIRKYLKFENTLTSSDAIFEAVY